MLGSTMIWFKLLSGPISISGLTLLLLLLLSLLEDQCYIAGKWQSEDSNTGLLISTPFTNPLFLHAVLIPIIHIRKISSHLQGKVSINATECSKSAPMENKMDSGHTCTHFGSS